MLYIHLGHRSNKYDDVDNLISYNQNPFDSSFDRSID